MKIKFLISSFLFITIVLACSKEEDEETVVTKSQQKRNEFAENIYENEIYPKLTELGQQLSDLEELTNAFNIDSTLTTRLELQQKWLKVALLTDKCKLFNVASVSRRFFFTELYAFPVNEDFLETISIYKGEETIDVATFPTNNKGLGMLEYLFYKQDSLQDYRGLVTAYLDDLIDTQEDLLSYWETDLKTDFVSGKTITINDGYGELINGFVNMIEVSKKERYEQPFGLRTSDNAQFQAERSESSKLLFKNSFDYLELLINDYYVVFLSCEGEEELAKDLSEAFVAYNISFDNLGSTTFEEGKGQIGLENLEEVQDRITEILARIKIDLATAYEVLITFSDADGD